MAPKKIDDTKKVSCFNRKKVPIIALPGSLANSLGWETVYPYLRVRAPEMMYLKVPIIVLPGNTAISQG